MKKIRILLLICTMSFCFIAKAQEVPSANPTMTITNASGEESEETSFNGSAPAKAVLKANIENLGVYTPYYEWKIYEPGKETSPKILRYDDTLEYTFTNSGNFNIKLLITFVNNQDSITYEQEEPFQVSISQSKLEMPNAFTPNGDGINDVYKAKEGYTSIISFHAVIFNRWGKKIFEWNDPSKGWDGKDGGSDVAVGAYYCIVNAKGADGHHYNLKKTINLLRDYNTSNNTSTGN